jgi:protein TonB
VPAGNYSIVIAAHGFAMTTDTVTLAPGKRAALVETLQVGRVHEEINVVAPGQPRQTAAQTRPTQRIKVGGNVQATMLIKQVKPIYPSSAQAQGVEGAVLLNAVIGKDGSLLSLAVVNKLADPDLAAAALAAAQQWRFRPTLLNGEPVEVATTITINFKLRE